MHTRHGRDVHATRRQTAIFRLLSKLVDRFVCVSEEVAALSRHQGIGSAGLRTILNGIDLDRFHFVGPDSAGPVVTVARLSPEKDVDNLVVRDRDRGKCRPPICESKSPEAVPAGTSWTGSLRELGVGRPHRLSWVKFAMYPRLLRRARMFVLPSLSEGIPLTALEAMARGLPVIATRVGGLPEVVENGATGLLVRPADPAALAAAIVEIWNNSPRGDRMGHAGRRRVEERFDVCRMVAQYEALYQPDTVNGPHPNIIDDVSIPISEPVESAAAVE